MMKVYLSGPITGTSDYVDRFGFAEEKVYQMFGNGVRVVNPVKIAQQLPEDISYEGIMRICFEALKACDVILLLPEWETSRGCNQEYGYALGIGKGVVKWEEWF